MKPVIGLVGCGLWGHHILRDLLKLGAEVHVVVRSAESCAKARAAGASSASTDLEALPKNVEGVIVATPISTHADVLAALVPLGKPIFVEKPMTNDAAAAARLTKQAGERIFVMDKWRYHPGVEELGRQVRSGALGDVLAVKTERLGWGNPHAEDVDSVWVLLPHDLAIVLETLGHLPPPRRAFSAVAQFGGESLMAVLEGAAGPRVVSEISTFRPDRRRAVTIVGTGATAVLADAYSDHVLLRRGLPGRGDGEEERIVIDREMPLEREIEAFIAFLRGGAPPRSSCAEGLLIVETIGELRRMAGV